MTMKSYLLLTAVTIIVKSSSAFSFQNQPTGGAEDRLSLDKVNRRDFVIQSSAAIFGTTFLTPSNSWAKDEYVPPTKETVVATFDPIRYELQNPNGGVATIQKRIDDQDWAGVMEFTKGYDLELRKARMGKAKKLLATKEDKEKATEYANAVTFDLIGINRNSRPGQENVEGANKYLQELREDVSKFLELESTIPAVE